MNDEEPTVEVDALIDAWIPEHPEVWKSAYSEPTAAELDAAVRRVNARRRELAAVPNGQRRRRRSIAAVVVGAAVIVGGSVGVAALIRSGQPSQPAQGIACRAAEDVDADAVVISSEADPVGACAVVWAAGDLGLSDVVPPLTACIAVSGVVEVFPGDTGVCPRLGLVNADPGLSTDNQAVVALNDRLVEEINAADCVSPADVVASAQRIVDESGLEGWTLEVRDDSTNADCAKVALDQSTLTITVIKFP